MNWSVILSVLFLSSATYVAADCAPGVVVGPCMCLEDGNSNLALQCSEVTDGAEITAVLEEIQVTEISSLDITNSPSLTSMPEGVFGSTSVLALRFYNTGLESLSDGVFTGSTSSSLKSLYIKHCDAFTDIDPSMIIALSSLEELYVSWTGMTALLGSIGLSSNLQYVDFSHNKISSIGGDYFANNTNLAVVLLAFNDLTTSSFEDMALNFIGGQGDLYIDMGYNQLSDGLYGVQFPMAAPRELVLSGNGIANLKEDDFAPLLETMSSQYPDPRPYILLDHNPLACGCETEWVVTNPNKELMQGAQCENGQLVSNLEVDDFLDC